MDGCYVKNNPAQTLASSKAYPGTTGKQHHAFFNKKRPQHDMVTGFFAAATICRRLDYGFEGDYYVTRHAESNPHPAEDFAICTISQAGTVVNVVCKTIPSWNFVTGELARADAKKLSIAGMTARRFGKFLKFSNGWTWMHRSNDVALQESR